MSARLDEIETFSLRFRLTVQPVSESTAWNQPRTGLRFIVDSLVS